MSAYRHPQKKSKQTRRRRQRRRVLAGGANNLDQQQQQQQPPPQQQQQQQLSRRRDPTTPDNPQQQQQQQRQWGPKAKTRKTPSNHPWILFMQMYLERENARRPPGQEKARYFKSLREAGKEYNEKVVKTMPALDPAIKDKQQIGMHKCAHVAAYFKAAAKT